MAIKIEKQHKYQPQARGFKPDTLFEVSGEIWFKTSNGAVRLNHTPFCHVSNETLEIVRKFQNCKLSTAVITIENIRI